MSGKDESVNRIAILIPTMGRSDRMEKIIENVASTSSHSRVYFVISPDDKESLDEVERIGASYFCTPGTYVHCINFATRETVEEFVLCGADDIEFMPGWEKELLEMADKNPEKMIFGGTDSWKISKTMLHISHPMVRRNYIKVDLYYPGYAHYMCDIELIQRGLGEDVVMIADKTLIEHHHAVKENKEDSTSEHVSKVTAADRFVYERRKGMFELYDTYAMQDGLVVPTKLNPKYQDIKVSIVVPSYKDTEVLLKCLESVVKNTYYRYELILINDACPKEDLGNSTYVDRKELFDSFELEDRSCELVIVQNKKQQWVGYNWNMGFEIATGNYVAFLNSDVTVSEDWDKYLVAGLDKYTIACPYQTNSKSPVPYAFASHPMIKDRAPNMINGAAFMVQRDCDLFPIPENIKHWGTDSVLSDRANKQRGVGFFKQSVVYHSISASSNAEKPRKLLNRIWADIVNYKAWLIGEGMSEEKAAQKTDWIFKVIKQRKEKLK